MRNFLSFLITIVVLFSGCNTETQPENTDTLIETPTENVDIPEKTPDENVDISEKIPAENTNTSIETLTENTDTLTAYIIDAAVEGLDYINTYYNGTTDINGSFKYSLDTNTTFYIGGIKLGTINNINPDKKVFIQDLVGVSRTDITNGEVLKISRFLQSIDEDNDPSNGIKISNNMKEKMKNQFFDFQTLNMNEIENLVTNICKKHFISEAETLYHLNNGISEIGLKSDYHPKAPNISGVPLTSIDANNLYSFTPSSYDENHDSLTFSIINKPSWADFNISNGELSGTPTFEDAGTYSNIVISVTDNISITSLNSFEITVNSDDYNDTQNEAYSINLETNIMGTIEVSDDVDYFKFYISENTIMKFKIEKTSTTGSVYAYIYNSLGEVVSNKSVYSFSSTSYSTDYLTLKSGTYYIKIKSNSPNTTYEIILNDPESVKLNTLLTGALEGYSKKSFKLELTDRTTIEYQNNEYDHGFKIYDNSFNELVSSYYDTSKKWITLESGIYYIEIANKVRRNNTYNVMLSKNDSIPTLSEIRDILNRVTFTKDTYISYTSYVSYTIKHNTFENIKASNSSYSYFYVNYYEDINGNAKPTSNSMHLMEVHHMNNWIFFTSVSVYLNNSAKDPNYHDYANEIFIGKDNSPSRSVNYDATVTEILNAKINDDFLVNIFNADYMSFNPYDEYYTSNSQVMEAYKDLYKLYIYAKAGYKIPLE